MEALVTIAHEAGYLLGLLFFLPLWIFLYWTRPRSRREMLVVGISAGMATVIFSHFFALHNYWDPPYLFGRPYIFEDFLYGFIYLGIASELGEAILRRRDRTPTNIGTAALLKIILLPTLVALPIFYIISLFPDMNAILPYLLVPALFGFGVCVMRPDLIIVSLVNAIAVTVLTSAAFYIALLIESSSIDLYWKTENLSGILWLNIPIEEYLFAFTVAFGISNSYEYFTDTQLERAR